MRPIAAAARVGKFACAGLLFAVAVGACGTEGQPAADPSSPSPSTSAPTPTPTPTPESDGPPLPEFTPYKAPFDTVEPRAKIAAAQAIEKDGSEEVTNVVFTQYFGYSPSQASILVLAQGQRRTASDGLKPTDNTYHVRVRRSGRTWNVTSITPARPASADPSPSQLAESVLANPRIVLPEAARADVASGTVADEVLRSMLEVARDHSIDISVISSGHPVLVFGTGRRSDHPPGYAYDIGAIDGKLVADPSARRLVESVMRDAKATGAYQVGGPFDLDGGGTGYFADDTHSDHIHVGFSH